MSGNVNDALRKLFEAPLLDELERCPRVTAQDGQVLEVADGRYHYIPIVLEGAIRISRVDESSKEILMYHIRPMESCIISLTSCLHQNFSNMDTLLAVSETATTMLLVNDKQARAWHDTYKSWRDFVTGLYDARLSEILHVVDAVAFKSVDQRMLDYLHHHCDAEGVVHITHQELAYRIGSAREVVSRLLKQLERVGRLRLSRGQIRLSDVPGQKEFGS
ncbi:MAG: Crp/Fnr family transcriptional regulator [Calditrichaeota bacterium]|nr:MAG: Crp/Fnr family transcriptional regulator [Calditrichota bacterium]